MSRPVKIVLVVLVGLVGVYIAASFVLSGLVSARIQGNESSAIGSVRAVMSAQAAFAAAECQGLYAPRLTALGTNDYVSPDLAVADVVERSGYRITLRGSGEAPSQPGLPPACAGATPAYVVIAEPVEPGVTGNRYFRANGEDVVIVEATTSDFSDAKPLQ